MKILQVVTDTDRRGAQVFATDLGLALLRREHDVLTVALGPGRLDSQLEHQVLGRRRRSPGSIRQLRDLMSLFDVVVAHGSTTLLACTVAGTGVTTPWVYRQIGETLYWAPTRRRRARVAMCLQQASVVVALGGSQRDVLADRFGVARERIHVVPTGVPSGRFRLADDACRLDARRRFGLQPDAMVVTYVGALSPEKGVETAIEAVAALPGVHLLLAGGGAGRADLERQAARCAPDRFHFAGVLDDVEAAYAAADVVVLPSQGGDSMPATIIEAGLCGRATVAAGVGAIPDVIEAGVTGDLVPPSDALHMARAVGTLLADPPRRDAFGAAAHRRCLERFDIDVVAGQWEAALDDAVRLK